jgi:hypothetical protein
VLVVERQRPDLRNGREEYQEDLVEETTVVETKRNERRD